MKTLKPRDFASYLHVLSIRDMRSSHGTGNPTVMSNMLNQSRTKQPCHLHPARHDHRRQQVRHRSPCRKYRPRDWHRDLERIARDGGPVNCIHHEKKVIQAMLAAKPPTASCIAHFVSRSPARTSAHPEL